LIVALALANPCAADPSAREYEVKAAFLYNFTQFTTWPPYVLGSADTPFVVALIGDDPFNGALERVFGGKTVNGRPVVVKHFASPDEMGPCQVLFVPGAQDDSLSALFQKLGNSAVLTVGESDKFIGAGGGIRFFIEENRMRFEIDLTATDAARLKLSAKLIKLAKVSH